MLIFLHTDFQIAFAILDMAFHLIEFVTGDVGDLLIAFLLQVK